MPSIEVNEVIRDSARIGGNRIVKIGDTVTLKRNVEITGKVTRIFLDAMYQELTLQVEGGVEDTWSELCSPQILR